MIGPENTTLEIGRSGCDTAVLGIGSFEQHSAHLPMETDFFFASRVSREVAASLEAMLLNPLPYSTSLEHLDFAGTVTLKPDTLRSAIWDIAESVDRWGIRYLVLLNAHGGNFCLIPTARQWNMERKQPHLLLVDFFSGLSDMGDNLHAGEVETSMMMHLAPERVRADKPEDFVPKWTRADLTHFGMKGISPTGVWGYPSRADAAKGEKWLTEAVEYSVQRIQSLKRAIEGRVARDA
ncbi:MAG: creatininase family protein [Spirochaetaceae bacterium]|nr:MAG: creatininase family protein [Spirochaetaceae bacterium]